ATAVTCEDRSLTYGELDRRANQLARRLKSLGVGPDVLVGLCMERSVEMMVALVAIHKAGGAYVPLHPAYVIYTSGSTGKPKGVMVEHRNVVNFFAGMDHHLGSEGGGTWVAVTSL